MKIIHVIFICRLLSILVGFFKYNIVFQSLPSASSMLYVFMNLVTAFVFSPLYKLIKPKIVDLWLCFVQILNGSSIKYKETLIHCLRGSFIMLLMVMKPLLYYGTNSIKLSTVYCFDIRNSFKELKKYLCIFML